MSLPPEIVIHMSAALGALAIGPFALWTRQGATPRPRLHRALGYAWVTLMVITAVSALFIHVSGLPNLAGFSPVHLLIPVTLLALFASFRHLAQGNIAKHRQIMRRLYWGACVITFGFTLLPNRYLGSLLWPQLGLLADSLLTTGHPMLKLVVQHPQALGTILQRTPVWVWATLLGLLALGLSQTRARKVSLIRVALTPLAMTAFAIWGMVSAFGASPIFGDAMMVWLLAAAWAFAIVAMTQPPRGAAFDPASRTVSLPGSWTPLALVVGIFLTKYIVGVDLAMQPSLALDASYTLVVAALYGAFSGVLGGRTARLLLRGPRLVAAYPA